MSHFLLALIVLALCVIVVVEAWSGASGRAQPVEPALVPVRGPLGGPAARGCARRNGRRRDRVRASSGGAEGGQPTRHRDHGHRVRPRARRGGIWDRLPHRSATWGSARGAPIRGSSGRLVAPSRARHADRSSARCSTAMPSRGASCSCTSSSRRRSGGSRSRSPPRSGAHLPRSPAAAAVRTPVQSAPLGQAVHE